MSDDQCLKTLIEKLIEYNRFLVLIFVDFEKTFDIVELSGILKECRIDYKYSSIIRNIYEKVTTTAHFHITTKKI